MCAYTYNIANVCCLYNVNRCVHGVIHEELMGSVFHIVTQPLLFFGSHLQHLCEATAVNQEACKMGALREGAGGGSSPT